nr:MULTISPECIES: TetR family transcriptional regulator [unclassified Actinomyces]
MGIIEADGVQALTYESLAAATGMSRSGLLYHFPSRHEMLVDCHRYGAARWEAELESLAGGRRAEELTSAERRRALVLSLGKTDPLIELLMTLHAQQHPDYAACWDEVESRWMHPQPGADDGQDLSEVLLVLLTTGLWVHDHLSSQRLDPTTRQKVVDALLARIDAGEPIRL